MHASSPYKISALVSLYNAERFIEGCLQDLVEQSIFTQTEVIIIDACSPQNERAIVEKFTQKYENIVYYRTQERETLYASWNRAIRMARGSYITNANADDRHAPKALETLAAELDAHPHVALVYANSRVTEKENSTFSNAPLLGRMVWTAYDHIRLLYACYAGPQPMWRRSVHEELGYFNEAYTIAGDYDMWLRISERYPFRHIPKMLGLYLSHEHNLSKSSAERLQHEEKELYDRALQHFFSKDFIPHTPFIEQLSHYEKALNNLLEQKERGKTINLQEIEFYFYAKVLVLVKLGHMSQAQEILRPFTQYNPLASKVAHLYHFLKQY